MPTRPPAPETAEISSPITVVEGDRFLRATNRGFRGLEEATEGEWRGPYNFVQMADTQLGLMKQMKGMQWMRYVNSFTFGATKGLMPIPLDLNSKITKEQSYETELDYTRRAVRAINALEPRPRFVVVCGDLVHAFPKAAAEQESQIADFKA